MNAQQAGAPSLPPWTLVKKARWESSSQITIRCLAVKLWQARVLGPKAATHGPTISCALQSVTLGDCRSVIKWYLADTNQLGKILCKISYLHVSHTAMATTFQSINIWRFLYLYNCLSPLIHHDTRNKSTLSRSTYQSHDICNTQSASPYTVTQTTISHKSSAFQPLSTPPST